jgi:hypothetical protein
VKRWAFRLLAALTVLSWLPVAVITASYAVALLMGCDPQRGSLLHCLWPEGDAVEAVRITGWTMLVLGPLALLTVGIWAVIGLVALVRR